jgi:hypothetical protein
VDHSERDISADLLGDFNVRGSLGEKFVNDLCPYKRLDLRSLKVIAFTCAQATGIKIGRPFQRGKDLIYKWLTLHYDDFAHLVDLLTFETQDLLV